MHSPREGPRPALGSPLPAAALTLSTDSRHTTSSDILTSVRRAPAGVRIRGVAREDLQHWH